MQLGHPYAGDFNAMCDSLQQSDIVFTVEHTDQNSKNTTQWTI